MQKRYLDRHTGYTGATYAPAPGDNIPIVLASGSTTRARILKAAGVFFSTKAPDLDEDALRRGIAGATDAAQLLANRKALAVSQEMPLAWVIGSDQILALDTRMLGKPGSRPNARAQLTQLQGATHALVTAVSVARAGRVAWQHVDCAELTMRPLSDAAIEHYLDRAGSAVLGSPGAYHLEGLGATLFERVCGDYFGILGLPLLPLLAALRERGALAG